AGTDSECLVDVLVEVEGGQNQDSCTVVLGEDASGRLEPVQLGHADVHEDDGGAVARRLLDGFETVARFGDDLDVLFFGEENAEAGADHRLVVGDEDADRHVIASVSGSRVSSTKPPPFTLPALILPP